MQKLDETIGLKNVMVWHCNDAKDARGSKRDRHEHVGKGTIGLEAFRRLLNDPRTEHAAFIAETPIEEPGDDLRNIETLKSLVDVAHGPGKAEESIAEMSETKIEMTANQPEQRELRYEPQRIEEKWHARWESNPALYAAEPHTASARNITCWRCCRILPAPCIWATCGITPLGTRSRVICG